MARSAVHAAMAGNTEMLRPMARSLRARPDALAARFRKHVDTRDDLWTSVLESTGQPPSFLPRAS
jgi:6-phosphofructokinase 1